jgi:hypothetical protein
VKAEVQPNGFGVFVYSSLQCCLSKLLSLAHMW